MSSDFNFTADATVHNVVLSLTDAGGNSFTPDNGFALVSSDVTVAVVGDKVPPDPSSFTLTSTGVAGTVTLSGSCTFQGTGYSKNVTVSFAPLLSLGIAIDPGVEIAIPPSARPVFATAAKAAPKPTPRFQTGSNAVL